MNRHSHVRPGEINKKFYFRSGEFKIKILISFVYILSALNLTNMSYFLTDS